MAEPAAQIDVGQWHKRIDAGLDERKPHEVAWSDVKRRAEGPHFRREGDRLPDQRSPVNLFNNFIRLVLPHLLPRDRRLEVLVNAKRPGPEYERSADLQTNRVNAILQEIRFAAEARVAVRNALFAVGWIKVGFEARTNIVTVSPETQGKPGEPVDVDRARVDGAEYCDPGLPFAMSVSPWRMVGEPGPERLDSLAWVAHQLFVPMRVVQTDPRYARVRNDIKASHRARPRSDSRGDADQQQAEALGLGYAEFWEICERDSRRVLLIPGKQTGCRQVADVREWPEGIEGFPYVRIAFDESEGFFYPIPPLSITLDVMSGTDALFTRMTDQTTGARTNVFYDPKGIEANVADRIANAKDNEIIPVPGLTEHLQVVTFNPAASDVQAMYERTKATSDEMSGVGEFMRAVSPASPRASATEISAAMAAQGVRMDDMRGAVHEAIAKVAEMVGALLIVHADALADVALPVGEGDDRRFVALGPGVVGEFLDYGYETVVASVEKTDPSIRQKRNQDLIAQSMDPNLTAKLQQEGKLFRTAPLIERQLRDMGEKNPDAYFVDLPPPNTEAETAAAREEDAIMARTGEVLPVSPGEDHQAHYQQHLADYQASGGIEAIAAHAAMHEQYLQAAQGEGGGGAAGVAPGGDGGEGTAGGAEQLGALQAQAG